MNLEQALSFSSISTVGVDGCSFAPELGVTLYCEMHDYLLVHLVRKSRPLSGRQIQLLYDQGFNSNYSLTRLQADRLFRDGLAKKVRQTTGLKSLGYRLVKWTYYYAVRLRSLI